MEEWDKYFTRTKTSTSIFNDTLEPLVDFNENQSHEGLDTREKVHDDPVIEEDNIGRKLEAFSEIPSELMEIFDIQGDSIKLGKTIPSDGDRILRPNEKPNTTERIRVVDDFVDQKKEKEIQSIPNDTPLEFEPLVYVLETQKREPHSLSDSEWILKYMDDTKSSTRELFQLYYGGDETNYAKFMQLIQFYFHSNEGEIDEKYRNYIKSLNIMRDEKTMGGELVNMYSDYTQWEVKNISKMNDYKGKVYDDVLISKLMKLKGKERELTQNEINTISQHIKENESYNRKIMTRALDKRDRSCIKLHVFGHKSFFYRNKTSTHENIFNFSYNHNKMMRKVNRNNRILKVVMGICLGKHLKLETWESYLKDTGLYQTDGNGNIVNHALLNSKNPYEDCLKLTYLDYITENVALRAIEEDEKDSEMTLRYLTKDILKLKLVTDYLNYLDATNKVNDGESKNFFIRGDKLNRDEIGLIYESIKKNTYTKIDEIDNEIKNLTEALNADDSIIGKEYESYDNVGPKDVKKSQTEIDRDRLFEVLFGEERNDKAILQELVEIKAWETVITGKGVPVPLYDLIEDEKSLEMFKKQLNSFFDNYADYMVNALSTSIYAKILIGALENINDGSGTTSREDMKKKIDTLKTYKFHLNILKSMLETIDEDPGKDEIEKRAENIVNEERKLLDSSLKEEDLVIELKELELKKEELVKDMKAMYEAKKRSEDAILNNGDILTKESIEVFSKSLKYQIMEKKKELLDKISNDGILSIFLKKVGPVQGIDLYSFVIPWSDDREPIDDPLTDIEDRQNYYSLDEWRNIFKTYKITLSYGWLNAFYATKVGEVYKKKQNAIISNFKKIESDGQSAKNIFSYFSKRVVLETIFTPLSAFAIIAAGYFVAKKTEHAKNSLYYLTAWNTGRIKTFQEDKTIEEESVGGGSESNINLICSENASVILNNCFKAVRTRNETIVMLNAKGCGIPNASDNYPVGNIPDNITGILKTNIMNAFRACNHDSIPEKDFSEGERSISFTLNFLEKSLDRYINDETLRDNHMGHIQNATNDIIKAFQRIGVDNIYEYGDWQDVIESQNGMWQESTERESTDSSTKKPDTTTVGKDTDGSYDSNQDIKLYKLNSKTRDLDAVDVKIEGNIEVTRNKYILVNNTQNALDLFNKGLDKIDGKWVMNYEQFKLSEDPLSSEASLNSAYEKLYQMFSFFGNKTQNENVVNMNKDIGRTLKLIVDSINTRDQTSIVREKEFATGIAKDNFSAMINKFINYSLLNQTKYDEKLFNLSEPTESTTTISFDNVRKLLKTIEDTESEADDVRRDEPQTNKAPPMNDTKRAMKKRKVMSIFTNSNREYIKNNQHAGLESDLHKKYFIKQNIWRSAAIEQLSSLNGGQFESTLNRLLNSDEKMSADEANLLNIGRFRDMISRLTELDPHPSEYDDPRETRSWDKYDYINLGAGALSVLFLTSGMTYTTSIITFAAAGISGIVRSSWFQPWKENAINTIANNSTKIVYWLMELFTSDYKLKMAFHTSTSILVTVVSMFYVFSILVPVFNRETEYGINILNLDNWNLIDEYEKGFAYVLSKSAINLASAYFTSTISYIALRRTYANFAIWCTKLKERGRLYSGLISENYSSFDPLYYLKIFGINLLVAPSDFLMNFNTLIQTVSMITLYVMNLDIEHSGESFPSSGYFSNNSLIYLVPALVHLMVLQTKNTSEYLSMLSESSEGVEGIQFERKKDETNPMKRYNKYAEYRGKSEYNFVNILDEVFYLVPNVASRVIFGKNTGADDFMNWSDEALAQRLHYYVNAEADKIVKTMEEATINNKILEFKKAGKGEQEARNLAEYYRWDNDKRNQVKEFEKRNTFVRIQMIMGSTSGLTNALLTSWNRPFFEGLHSKFEVLKKTVPNDEDATLTGLKFEASNLTGNSSNEDEVTKMIRTISQRASWSQPLPNVLNDMRTPYSMAWFTWRWLLTGPLTGSYEILRKFIIPITGDILPSASVDSLYASALTYSMSPFGDNLPGNVAESVRFITMLAVYGSVLMPVVRSAYHSFKDWNGFQGLRNKMIKRKLKEEGKDPQAIFKAMEEFQIKNI